MESYEEIRAELVGLLGSKFLAQSPHFHLGKAAELAAHKVDEFEKAVSRKNAETIQEDARLPLVQQDGKFQAGELHAADLINPDKEN